jgi:ribose transport system substrate-binding protein
MRHTPKTVLTALAVTGIVTAALTGCAAPAEGGGGDDTPTVAYFAPSLGIGYWQNVGYGVESQAKELGMNYVSYDANNSEAQQLANMNTAVTAGVDAIVIGPVSSNSVPPLLAIAKENGIPVAFAGIGPDASQTDFTSSVTANNEDTGKAEATFLCEAAQANGGSKVGMLSLPQDRENAQKYLKGAQAAFDDLGCELVQVLQTDGLTVQEAVTQTNDLLTAHPDISAIYGMYDEAGIGAVQVLEERGLLEDVVVATADGSPATVKLVRDGKLDALFLQEAVGQGIDATTQVHNALTGESTEQRIELLMPMVTPENIDDADIQAKLKRVYPPSAGAY